MKQSLLSSAEAAAHGARLAAADAMPHYPQPFATEIAKKAERLGGIDVFDLPTHSDALNAAIGSALSGKRVFLATSFVNDIESTGRVAQMGLPIVAVDISRVPGQFRPERNIQAFFNSGWLTFVCGSNQEIVDTVIRCYKLCEDNKVALPAVISIDHADFYEPVALPTEQIVKNFLPKQLKKLGKNASYVPRPRDTRQSVENAAKIYLKMDEVWKKKFKRSYAMAEPYMTEDAERVIITTGMHAATAKNAASAARKAGEKVGILRVVSLRPFPEAAVASLSGKKVAVVDSSMLLYSEIAKRISCAPFTLHSPSEKDFSNVLDALKK